MENFRVTCDGTPVGRVFTVKYLGVYLDASLDASSHAGHLMKTCAGRLAFLYRYSNLLDTKCRLTLCSTLIQPHIDSCCSAWYGSLTVSLKNRLDVIQRKMVRFVNGMSFRDHVGNKEMYNLSWLSIPDRVAFFRLIHVFKIRHDLAPKYLVENFKNVSDVHSHNTRGSGLNYQLSHGMSLARNSFAFLAAKEWNNLPQELKLIPELRVFKKRLKNYLFSRYD